MLGLKTVDRLERFMLTSRVKVFLATVVIEVAKEAERRRKPIVRDSRERFLDEVFPVEMRTEKMKITKIDIKEGIVTFYNPRLEGDLDVKVGDELFLHWKIDGLE